MSLPERVGRLRRLDRLGEGGFSSVWLYRDDELRSDVAVKALADNWAQRMDVRERFLEEARILRAADSDHVVRVYDVGEAGDTPYFVMTYADRGTLADLLTEGPLSLDRVVTLVRQAGDGLSVLHAKGVVHRDIKPQNLLLASDGLGRERLMVADLGVAKALLHASGLTQVVGTPAYMAPEQALGGGIDERADVHGLAAVAYHLLTGHLAREGSVSDLVRATLPTPPSSYVDLDPEVGAAVDAAILRGLEPDREDRWPDVQSLVDALAACAPDAPVTIYGDRTRNGRPYRSAAVARARHQTLVLLAWCVVVALAMFGASYAVVSLLQ